MARINLDDESMSKIMKLKDGEVQIFYIHGTKYGIFRMKDQN